MKIKKKINPKPIHAESNGGDVQPIRCTDTGEVLVHQTNAPSLENVERYLREGITVHHKQPVDVVLKKIEVEGTVSIKDTVTVEPVTVVNMPDEMKVQENLHVVQTPVAIKVAPFSFEGYGAVIIPQPCRVYSVYLTVYEPTFIEVVGITGEIWTGEFKMDLFPLFIQVDKVEVRVKEYVKGGGYILYESY
jgi:hypothetical protein